MKREVKSPKGAKINSPKSSKSEERELAEAIKYMIEQMELRFKNQVFQQMHKSTIEKFEVTANDVLLDALPDELRRMFIDQQTGNFAKVFLGLTKGVRRKLMKQFPDDRLEAFANNVTSKTDKRNANIFYKRVAKRVGIGKEELEATEGLTSQINAYKLETAQWIKKMRDETLQDWTANTLRLMAEGKGLPEILSQFDDMVEKRKNHAKFVARHQIKSFNSLVINARARNLGIEEAIWRTSLDGKRVRPSHRDREGKKFNLAKGLYSSLDKKWLLPGVDYDCRCDSEMIIPSMAA